MGACHRRTMLLDAGLCGAGRAHASAGAAACAGPGRAVTGGVRLGVLCVSAGGVRARPCRGLHCRDSVGHGGPGRRQWCEWARACLSMVVGIGVRVAAAWVKREPFFLFCNVIYVIKKILFAAK
jgi:hypothetical protein